MVELHTTGSVSYHAWAATVQANRAAVPSYMLT